MDPQFEDQHCTKRTQRRHKTTRSLVHKRQILMTPNLIYEQATTVHRAIPVLERHDMQLIVSCILMMDVGGYLRNR